MALEIAHLVGSNRTQATSVSGVNNSSVFGYSQRERLQHFVVVP